MNQKKASFEQHGGHHSKQEERWTSNIYFHIKQIILETFIQF